MRDVDEYLKKFGDKGWSPGVPAFRQSDCAACKELVHVSLETPPQVLLLEGEWGRLYDRSGPKMRLCAGEDGNEKLHKNKILKMNPEYFTAPGFHRAYAFNYPRVFEEGSKQSLTTKDAIGNSLVKSIAADDDDVAREKKVPRTVRSSHINEAVSRCVRKIFEKSLLTAPCVMTVKNSKERLVYDRKRIDPDDEKFMDKMLGDAFKILRRDSSLVQQKRSLNSGKKVKPYFQKQPRPKSFRRSTHYSSNSPLYEVQIPNEVGDPREDDDRWFANFQFHPVQRTVKAVINHELCHLFDQIDEAPSDPAQDPRDLCEFHEETRSQERQAFLLKQRIRYLEMIDLEGTEKRVSPLLKKYF